MLSSLPLNIPSELDAGAVDQQVQRLFRCAIGDLHRDPRLQPAQSQIVRIRPIEPSELDQTFDQAERLPKRKTEEHFSG